MPAAVLLALAACGGGQGNNVAAEAPAMPRKAPSGLDLVPLTIESGGNRHVFTVEVARSEPEQAQGLMYRTSLPPMAGMLFPFAPPRPTSFWMRNTYIPLDMIFIRPDGTIARVAANAVPRSDALVGVEEPVTAVLEIPGGRAAALGIREGDRVSWRE